MPATTLATAFAAATLGLTACGSEEYNDANAAYNADEANYVDDTADYNMGDMNDLNDMNAVDNAVDNATDNATGNEAIDANTSY